MLEDYSGRRIRRGGLDMKLVMNGVERCRGFFQLSSEEKGKGICCEKYLAMRKEKILLKRHQDLVTM